MSRLTPDEVWGLEEGEYASAVQSLLSTRYALAAEVRKSFRQFLVHWVVDTQITRMGAVISGDGSIDVLNYQRGRASLMEEFMAGLRLSNPDVYHELTKEVTEYERRRHSTDDRNPAEQYDDPGLDSVGNGRAGGEYDAGPLDESRD